MHDELVRRHYATTTRESVLSENSADALSRPDLILDQPRDASGHRLARPRYSSREERR